MWQIIVLIVALVAVVHLIFLKLKKPKGANAYFNTLIVIGSGGHTAEMLRLVAQLPNYYSPRTYIMASSDTTSEPRIKDLEAMRNSSEDDYSIVKIPRSRSVHQSYATSVITTLYSVIRSIPPVLQIAPDLVLCNGPGTCIPICAIVFYLKKLAFWDTKIIYIESFCRVKSLSLSGKIMLPIADEIVVQWPELVAKHPKTKYIGKLL